MHRRVGPVLVLAMLTLAGCGTPAGGGLHALSAGKLLPQAERHVHNASGNRLAGGALALKSYRGSVIVVNFWAAWCPPCVVETPQFQLAYDDLRAAGKKVAFIGVDTKDTRSSAQTFVHDNDITYPMLFDEDGNVALQLGGLPTPSLPDTVLIDKHGRVAGTYIGPLTPKDLIPMVDQLLAET